MKATRIRSQFTNMNIGEVDNFNRTCLLNVVDREEDALNHACLWNFMSDLGLHFEFEC